MDKIRNTIKHLVISEKNNNISELTHLQEYTNLISINCSKIGLTKLPPLPNILTELDCSENNLTELPRLPDTLSSLFCSKNNLTKLPRLPDTLTDLDCSKNDLTELPLLPDTLTDLNCSHNSSLNKLPLLPDTLTDLNCSKNGLIELPLLPDTLTNLNCSENGLNKLPPLPKELEILNCSKNNLTELPKNMPNTLIDLDITNNPMHTIDIPDNLNKKVKIQILINIKIINFPDKDVFLKKKYLDIFTTFDFGNLNSVEMICFNDFKVKYKDKTFKEISDYLSPVCQYSIGGNYFLMSLLHAFNNPDFDVIFCVEPNSSTIIGFSIVQLGECKNYPNYYCIKLICSKKISRLLLCFYMYCCRQVNQPIGLLELSGSITNIPGYIAYTKVGFFYDYSDIKLQCFNTEDNLPMKVLLDNKNDDNFYKILAGTHKYTNEFILNKNNNVLFNKKFRDRFEILRKEKNNQTVKLEQSKNVLDNYNKTLEQMQKLILISNVEEEGSKVKRTKNKQPNKKKQPNNKKQKTRKNKPVQIQRPVTPEVLQKQKTPSPQNKTIKCPPRCANGSRCTYKSKKDPTGICVKKTFY